MSAAWEAGFLIDETWRYSPAQRGKILAALRNGKRYRAAGAMARITEAAQLYRSDAAHDRTRPARKKAMRELRRVAADAAVLRERLARLDANARLYLDARMTARAGPPLTLPAWSAVLCALETAAALDGRGRPTDDAMTTLLVLLGRVWKDVHGTWPGRAYRAGATRRPDARHDTYPEPESGPFYRFVALCLDPLGIPVVPSGVLRKVLDAARRMEKNKRASPA